MDLHCIESRDELAPRPAPTPFSSDAPNLSTVPEVSLIFSYSPESTQQIDKRVASRNVDINPPNSPYRSKTIGSPIHVQKTLQEQGENAVSDSPKNSRQYCRPSRVTISPTGQHLRKTSSVRNISDECGQQMCNMMGHYETQERSSPNHRYIHPVSQSPLLLEKNGIYDCSPQTNTKNVCEPNFPKNIIHSNSAARQFTSRNDIFMNDLPERNIQNCIQNGIRPLHKHHSDGKHYDASQRDYTQDIGRPILSSYTHCLNSKVCHCSSCSSIRQNTHIPLQCTENNRRVLEPHPDCCSEISGLTQKSCQYNFYENVANTPRLTNCVQAASKTHANTNFDSMMKKNSNSDDSSPTNNVPESVTCNDRMQNVDNLVGSSSTNENKIKDRKDSDVNILKEIAIMNQKQCNILQGLLEQVVGMQANQMKILKEINEKLSNPRILEDTVSSKLEKHSTSSRHYPKMENAMTQTAEDAEFYFPKEDNRKYDSENKDDSSNNILTNYTNKTDNLPENAMVNNYNDCENDQNKLKKLQDRAVSWSAIQDVETLEESFTLHGVCVPTVVDQLPSSVHTMHLHVQDYHSSASYESISESRHTTENILGENCQENPKASWTLYDNIVGHVKKFLQTVPCEKSGVASQKTSQVEAIRFATIEKIRQLGVSIYENSTEIKEASATGKMHFESKVTASTGHHEPYLEKSYNDASSDLEMLALKYLKDDDICDLMNNQNAPGLKKTTPKSANLSIATQRYLEKYHLLPLSADSKDKRHINGNSGQIHMEENILDITTLKKQPKLL